MNITDVKTDIKNKAIKPYYIFAGDEIEVQRIYINKIAEVLGYNVVRADSIADVWGNIISPNLFDKPSVYVVRDDKDLMQNEVLQSQIEQNKLNDNVIILLLTTVDKRTKFYKSNSDKIVLFERLSTDLLMKYCNKLIMLNKSNSSRLIAICENDYSRLLLEIDKILRYAEWYHDPAMGYSLSYDDVFEQFIADGTIAIPPQDAVFDLVDAILNRQVSKAYALYEQCKAIGEANMVILSVLFTNTKQVLQVQECNSSDIAKSTGLTSWQIKNAKSKCGHYSCSELSRIMRLIKEIKKSILSGTIEDEMSVNYLLVQIL